MEADSPLSCTTDARPPADRSEAPVGTPHAIGAPPIWLPHERPLRSSTRKVALVLTSPATCALPCTRLRKRHRVQRTLKAAFVYEDGAHTGRGRAFLMDGSDEVRAEEAAASRLPLRSYVVEPQALWVPTAQGTACQLPLTTSLVGGRSTDYCFVCTHTSARTGTLCDVRAAVRLSRDRGPSLGGCGSAWATSRALIVGRPSAGQRRRR